MKNSMKNEPLNSAKLFCTEEVQELEKNSAKLIEMMKGKSISEIEVLFKRVLTTLKNRPIV